MMQTKMKVRSFLTEDHAENMSLKSKYEEIFKDAHIWMYKKWDGVHSAIINCIKEDIRNKHVLDLGCGAGRLALMCANFCSSVDGIDFSERAIKIARTNARFCGLTNASFYVSDLEDFCTRCTGRYGAVLLGGVLEHTSDPINVLRLCASVLQRDGIIVADCPGFQNARGDVYMTLLKLLHLPMSLADLHQITPLDMNKWAESAGLQIFKMIGTLYLLAFGLRGAHDLIERIPMAIRDKGVDPKLLHFSDLSAWLQERFSLSSTLVDWLVSRGMLREIPRSVVFDFKSDISVPKEMKRQLLDYMNEDLSSDPYMCEEAPYNTLGADTIYLLKKQGEYTQ